MRAIMSNKIRNILRNKIEAKELMTALNLFHNSDKDELIVVIGGETYIIKRCRNGMANCL